MIKFKKQIEKVNVKDAENNPLNEKLEIRFHPLTKQKSRINTVQKDQCITHILMIKYSKTMKNVYSVNLTDTNSHLSRTQKTLKKTNSISFQTFTLSHNTTQ